MLCFKNGRKTDGSADGEKRTVSGSSPGHSGLAAGRSGIHIHGTRKDRVKSSTVRLWPKTWRELRFSSWSSFSSFKLWQVCVINSIFRIIFRAQIVFPGYNFGSILVHHPLDYTTRVREVVYGLPHPSVGARK